MNLKLRKNMLLALVFVMMLSILAACGGGSGSGENTQTGGESGGETSAEQTPPAEAPATGWKSDLVLGAGALGGNYYNTGAAIGDLLSKELDQVERVSVMSGGNLSFIPMLQEGKADLILGTPDAHYYAWGPEEGQGFKADQRLDKLRLMGAFYINIMDMIVPSNSPIQSLADIGDGKVGVIDVSLKEPMEILLQAHGVEKPNVVVIADWNQIGQALRDGSLKAVQAISAQPIPAIVELSNSIDIRLLPLEDEAVENFLANPKTRFFQKVTQPAGTYSWQTEDYVTVGRGSVISASSDLSEEQVYEMTKTMYEKVDDLAKIVPVARDFTIEMMQDYLDAGVILFPLHPGARKYFEENGVTIPDTVPQE